ncbi:MAG: hypothetical protein ASARMPREDX12_008889 [Alectoria sarmentosa]|nr:MAG: hypothetical protein ASARMPREDX12_008889 [Alectoria sarmentosa]
MVPFTTLLQLWLLTILVPLALGAPVLRESVSPSVASGGDTSNTDNSERHMGLNRANKVIYVKGSKTTSDDKGSPSLGGYSAHGTGVIYKESSTFGKGSGTEAARSLSTGTSSGTSGVTSGGAKGDISGGASIGTSSDGRASKELKEGGSHGDHGEHIGGMKGGKMHEQAESQGSGGTTGSAASTGSERTTTGSESTTDTTGTTTGGESTASGTATGSDGTTSSKSKHK